MKRAAILLSIALLSAGCATTREAISLPELDSWETRTAVLGELREWEFRGRIAVKAGDEGFNGKIRWIQDDETFNTTVGGPIGIGTVRIEGSGQTVTLTDKDGVRTELQDAELELRYRYGWTIPLRSLRYWALGVPDPALAAETRFGADGQLEYLSQRGWHVAITRYREGGGQSMPNRLSAENGDTTVRLVIDSWYFFK